MHKRIIMSLVEISLRTNIYQNEMLQQTTTRSLCHYYFAHPRCSSSSERDSSTWKQRIQKSQRQTNFECQHEVCIQVSLMLCLALK